MKKLFFVSTLLLVLILCFGHEYILLAYKYRLHKGDTLEVHLFVADGFNIQLERPFQKAITRSFELMTKEGTTDLLATENGALPLINRPVDFDGGGLIHLERNYSRISLPSAKFFDYLKEDHLTGIATSVDRSRSVQRERYSRYIKCLVQSGTDYSDTMYKKRIGQAFEIILLQNPYRLKKGDVMQAKIIFQNKPFVNKIITARARSGSQPSVAYTATTNAAGICSFVIKQKGEWFLHATHMIPCADKTDSDWESFWTSYSFEIDK